MTNHDEFYRGAEYYDIAFDFRNVAKECDFVESVWCPRADRRPESFLELGAGPALHAREFARRGLRAAALDLSEHMVAYGRECAARDGVEIDYRQGDMIDFTSGDRFDVAVLLMDSACYLPDNEAVYRHFESVAAALNPGGLYLLEMSHPRDFWGIGVSSETVWDAERGYKKVHVQWGSKDDGFDPITQISNVTARIDYVDGLNRGTIEERAPQRSFGVNEFKALVDASKRFEIVDFYGSMNAEIPFSNEKESWRMIPVLQKI